jgi:CrcB protein
MTSVLFVALGGAFGATLRYTLSGLVNRYFEGSFPAGTLGVNLMGCLAVGLLWEPLSHTAISPHIRTFFLIGILGAFTTFSTYGIESVNLLRTGEVRLALLNLFLSNVLGIGFVLVGLGISRLAGNAL